MRGVRGPRHRAPPPRVMGSTVCMALGGARHAPPGLAGGQTVVAVQGLTSGTTRDGTLRRSESGPLGGADLMWAARWALQPAGGAACVNREGSLWQAGGRKLDVRGVRNPRHRAPPPRVRVYRGTSLIRKRLSLGPYGRPIPRASTSKSLFITGVPHLQKKRTPLGAYA